MTHICENIFHIAEGSLGINNYGNKIAVSRITVNGAIEIPYEEEDFFDFDDGLVGTFVVFCHKFSCSKK